MSTVSDQKMPARCPECSATPVPGLWWCPQCYHDLRPESERTTDDDTTPIPLPRAAATPPPAASPPAGATPVDAVADGDGDIDEVAERMVAELAASQTGSPLIRARSGREQAVIAVVVGLVLLGLLVGVLTLVGLLT